MGGWVLSWTGRSGWLSGRPHAIHLLKVCYHFPMEEFRVYLGELVPEPGHCLRKSLFEVNGGMITEEFLCPGNIG